MFSLGGRVPEERISIGSTGHQQPSSARSSSAYEGEPRHALLFFSCNVLSHYENTIIKLLFCFINVSFITGRSGDGLVSYRTPNREVWVRAMAWSLMTL